MIYLMNNVLIILKSEAFGLIESLASPFLVILL